MNLKRILFKGGYKYQLYSEYSLKTNIYPGHDIELPFLSLGVNGYLVIKPGYAWDGPSGPVVDTKRKFRASLTHDALYQLRRAGKLTAMDMIKADDLFMRICIEDGLAKWRAKLYYIGLRKFGQRARSKRGKRVIKTAP